MDVSIITINYNTISLLLDAIDSVIFHTKNLEYEIIVVDNNSSDNSESIILHKYGNLVIYVKLSENIGFGRANNEGAKYAQGRNIFLLNPDTILLNNAVKTLSDFLDNNSNAGICGGNLYDNNEQPALSYSMFLPSIAWEINLLFSCRLERLIYGKNAQFNFTNEVRKVGYITGADLMIRADLFRHLNGFDADFFMYYEETELTYRLKKTGYEVYSIPQARIIHLEGQALSGNWKKRTKLSLESREKYYQKTCGKFIIKVCNLIFRINALCKCVMFKFTKNTDKYEYWKFISTNI